MEPGRKQEYRSRVASMRRLSWVVVSSLGLIGLGLGACGTSNDPGTGSGGSMASGGAAAGGTSSGGAPVGDGGAAAGGLSESGGASTGGGGDASGGSPSGGAPNGAGGESAGGSGTGGEGTGGSPAEPAQVANNSGVVTFTWPERTLVVDGTRGARVVSLKAGGNEFLSQAPSASPSGDDLFKYGSTFWTSPQSAWGWPPIVAIDSAAYTVTVDDGTATFTSSNATVAEGKDVRIKKAFSVDTAKDVITIVYTIENVGAGSASFAPWEITRVPKSGLTFFPTGESASTPEGMGMLPVTNAGGITWFQHPGMAVEEDRKIHADGKEGWLAHATPTVTLIKSFADLQSGQAAPTEGEVEIYSAKDGTYVEVENQGAYKDLAAGASLTYEVRWLLRETPEDVTVAAGDASLASFVRAELSEAGL